MFGKKWEVSRRRFGIIEERGVSIPMSDGILIDADLFRPDSSEKFPAILGVHPYEKELQSAPIHPQGLNMANGGIEAGDYNFYVRRGYVQVVANVRGSGGSGGIYTNYGPREVKDTCEIIEWIAGQPWCDGNVGMFGVSAFAVAQQQVAALFTSIGNSQLVFLLTVNVFLLIGGALMEGVTLLILTTPLLASVAVRLGIDPIHFGMVVVMNVVLGAVTPPFGQLVFFVSSMTGIRSEEMFKQVFRFLPLLLLVLGIVTFFPETYLWTVRLFGPSGG